MKKTITPLILVDIDGVCNAFNAPQNLPEHQYVARAGRYTVVLDKRHPAWFKELERRAEVVWSTMWQNNAATQFGPVAGFGTDWEFVNFDQHHTAGGRMRGQGVVSYKWPGILATVKPDQPLVYVDDDMSAEHHDWAAFRNELGVPTLFIQPDPQHGLTRKQYESIVEFLDTHVVLSPAEVSMAA